QAIAPDGSASPYEAGANRFLTVGRARSPDRPSGIHAVALKYDPVMDFSVLGPVQAFLDGRPVDLGVRKQRFVLAVLLLEANKHVPAERLIELAWPEGEAPDTARTVIHTQISRLRATFAQSEDVDLVREGSGYQLRLDPLR